jgi:hypothetical protein
MESTMSTTIKQNPIRPLVRRKARATAGTNRRRLRRLAVVVAAFAVGWSALGAGTAGADVVFDQLTRTCDALPGYTCMDASGYAPLYGMQMGMYELCNKKTHVASPTVTISKNTNGYWIEARTWARDVTANGTWVNFGYQAPVWVPAGTTGTLSNLSKTFPGTGAHQYDVQLGARFARSGAQWSNWAFDFGRVHQTDFYGNYQNYGGGTYPRYCSL